MRPIVEQRDFFGGSIISGSVRDRLFAILKDDPFARDNYKRLIGLYWLEYDGLDSILGDRKERFLEWLETHATSPKTLQNRAMELQNDYAELEASPDIAELRERQAKAGPIGIGGRR